MKRIKHPGWLLEAVERLDGVMRLYRAGHIPQTLEVFMVRTPLLYALRSIYGTDLLTAWHLLLHAASDRLRWHVAGLKVWWYRDVRGMTEEQFMAHLDRRSFLTRS